VTGRFNVHGSRLKNTDTDTHTGTDFDEKEHERLRKIEKKWENRINDWIVKIDSLLERKNAGKL